MYCYTYKIPLHPSPLALSERRGIIVETEEGWGEAAPLPGFSKDPLDALIFALSSAKQPFPKEYPGIRLNALASTLQEAEAALQLGFQTIKYKVRGLSPKIAAQTIARLQSLQTTLRIDANRSWSVIEANRFLDSIDPLGIEYIEEPIDDPKRLHELPLFPFALDETLLEPEAESLAALSQVRAFVLKPTLLGSRLDRWIHLGKEQNKTLTFSSSFESSIALVHIARLQKIHAPETAAGLDTFRAFKQNFLPFPIEKGELSPQLIPPIDRSWLVKIAH